MPYLTSGLVAAAALVVLALLALSAVRSQRRAARAAHLAGQTLSERLRLLSARAAALRVELARRRGRTDVGGARHDGTGAA